MMMFMMIMVIMMRMTRMRKRVEVEVGWRLEARSVRSGQEDKEQEGFRQMGSDKITIPVHLIIICRRILIDHHGGRLPCLVLIVIISDFKLLPDIDEYSLLDPTRIFQSNSTRSKENLPVTACLTIAHHHHRLGYEIGGPGLYI